MSSKNPVQQEFRKYFANVIKHWGLAREDIFSQSGDRLAASLDNWYQWAESKKFVLLSSITSEIQTKLTEKESDEKQVVKSIDSLLGKLIAAINQPENPYLIRHDTQTPQANSNMLNIAIIDDSEIARVTTKAMLDRFNFNVFTYESIFEFEQDEKALNNIRIVLLDVIMPNITELILFEFAKRLRARNIEVILVSGSDTMNIRLQAVRADIGGYVTKPFDINVLVSNIRWLCNLDINRPFRVLLLDDQPLVNKFLSRYTKQNDIELTYYSNSRDFFDNLDLTLPDMFLLDVNMPEVSGIEACKILRQQQRYEYVPIVFLSADNSLETKLKALEAGADDIILKDNPPDIIFKQIERRIMRGQQIRSLAVKDSLTGLLNHGQLMEAANSAYRFAQRNKTHIAVAMIDIDNFKHVNDSQGHMVGDNVIIGLAQLLKTAVRDTDVVGRYGGEEFMMVFHTDNIAIIEEKLNNVRSTFSKLKFRGSADTFSCTFSCGIATSVNNDTLKNIIHIADQMMYEIKKNGKNGVKTDSIL